MRGMDARTGKALSGFGHLRQSITDILTTPVNTRVMQRDYGFDGFAVIDAPAANDTAVRLFAAVARALDRWEPRFRLTRIRLDKAAAGRVEISLEGEERGSGNAVRIEGLTIA